MTKARILADYVAGGTTAAEFDYMDGVTSNVQTQMDAKAPLASPTFTGNFTSVGIDDNADALAMTIDANENIGIKTNSPSSADSNARNLVISSTTPGITIRDSAATDGSNYIKFADSAAWGQGAIQYWHGGDAMLFYTNGANERMRIDSSGNLGIGTTPKSWMTREHVIQIGDSGSFAGRNDEDTVTINNNTYSNSSGSTWDYIGTNGTQAAAQYLMDNGGNHLFRVSNATGAADAEITWTRGMQVHNTGQVNIGPDQLRYGTSECEVSNATSGQPALMVKGGTLATYNHSARTDPTSGGIQLGYHPNYKGTVCFNTGGSTEMQIETNYNGSGIVCKAYSGGVRLASEGTSWGSASDERYKDIEENITDALVKVNKLRAVIGKYKTDKDGTRRSFLIAQDFLDNFPEPVTVPVASIPKFEGDEVSDPDKEPLELKYTEVIPLLVASIKELSAKVTTLESA